MFCVKPERSEYEYSSLFGLIYIPMSIIFQPTQRKKINQFVCDPVNGFTLNIEYMM